MLEPLLQGQLKDQGDYTKWSKEKVDWICSLGHEWNATIHSRAVNGNGCPICANRQILHGFNDLTTTHPNLEFKLVYEDPTKIYARSEKKIEWCCNKGHKFIRSPKSMTKENAKCPVCSGGELVVGVNDLKTTHPTLAEELVNEDPVKYTAQNNIKVLWECLEEHRWEATINSRAIRNSGCPYCSGRFLLRGFNDLQTTHPQIAEEAFEDVSMIQAGSNKKIKWKCVKGHQWEAQVVKRTSRGDGCPYCSGALIIEGETDLKSVSPDIAKEFVGDSTTISWSSSKSVLWECSLGHQWNSTPNSRQRGDKCPYCSNKKVLVGFNDLLTTHPEIAKLCLDDPTKYTFGSKTILKWKGMDCGHTFYKAVFDVTKRELSCPICYGKLVVSGINDLAKLFPEVYSQLKTPEVVSPWSGRKLSWVCNLGHEWEAVVSDRVGSNRPGTNCPICSKSGVSSSEKSISSFLQELGFHLETNTRTILSSGKELDIYIPSKNIAIEYNGIYWHSKKDLNYHANKTQACAEKGIQLIHVWEDDYNSNPELIHRMLEHKLGVSTQEKIPARKTTVKEITVEQAKTFLNENHIQGFGAGSIRLGLFTKDSNKLVAVTTLKRHEDTLTLERYATSAIIPGGQSKFLSYIDKNIDYIKMVTFADLTVSDGSLYERTGWIKDKILPPDYKYVYRGKREHKFNFRKKRFKDDPNLIFQEDLTERELAELNNLPRIYDSGKIRYVRYRDIINKDVNQLTDRKA